MRRLIILVRFYEGKCVCFEKIEMRSYKESEAVGARAVYFLLLSRSQLLKAL